MSLESHPRRVYDLHELKEPDMKKRLSTSDRLYTLFEVVWTYYTKLYVVTKHE